MSHETRTFGANNFNFKLQTSIDVSSTFTNFDLVHDDGILVMVPYTLPFTLIDRRCVERLSMVCWILIPLMLIVLLLRGLPDHARSVRSAADDDGETP